MIAFGERVFKEIMKLLKWFIIQDDFYPSKRGNRTDGYTEGRPTEHTGRGWPSASQGEAPEETSPADTMILDWQPPKV